MTLRDLKLRLRALIAPRRVERELDEELAFHIDRDIEKHVQRGVPLGEARARARARFGSAALAADECRDARGTAFVDTTVRDVLSAVRTVRRAPLAAITIVSTVALGLGLVAMVFTLLNWFIFRVDDVRDPAGLFGVERPEHPGAEEHVPFTRPVYEALRRDTSVFADAFAIRRGVSTRIDGRVRTCALVTGNFFQVVGVHAALGRTLVPADDERSAGRPVIVLSHKGWSRWFDNDPAVVGRTVRINGVPFEIVGVTPEGFRGLTVGGPDYWAPLSLVGHFRPSSAGKEDEVEVDVIGRLRPGLSPAAATAGLSLWAAAQPTPAAGSVPPGIRLEPRQGTVADDLSEVLLVFAPLFFAFGLILLIGCANVANLLLARGVSRQREIGIRLSLGASRRRIVRQLLTESLLLALASAVLALFVSRLGLEATVFAALTTMPPQIAETVGLSAPPADWRVLVFLIAGALASTLLFGLAPALQATRLELVRTMRGEVTKDARPGRARNALIASQVGASALLLISAAVFLRGAWASSTTDVGFRIADTLIVEIATEPLRAAVVQTVRADPVVALVAASLPHPLSMPTSAVAQASAAMGASSRSVTAGYRGVSGEYFAVLDIPILRGRGFTPVERSVDAGVAVVSETTAHELWPDRPALGQVLQVTRQQPADVRGPNEPPLLLGTFTVVGVARDVPGFRLADWPLAAVYVPTAADSVNTALTARIHGDPDEARAALLDRLTTVDPAITEVSTLRMMAGLDAYLLGIASWVTVVLGALALALTLSGLFSVLSYVVEQRTKEIGVRMALGATAGHVTRLVRSQLFRPVAFGLIVGGGLAAALATLLLSAPDAAWIGDVVRVLDPVAYASSLTCIVAACLLAAWVPARRAARIDPIATLRRE